MQKFDMFHIKELKEFLYNSDTHDAILQNIQYDRDTRTLYVETFYRKKTFFTFHNVKFILSISGNWIGSCKEINSLTVEEDASYIQPFNQNYNIDLSHSLYLIFQMFSGDEIHVICDELYVDGIN